MRGTTPPEKSKEEEKKTEVEVTETKETHPLATYIPLDQKLMKDVKDTDESK